MCKLSDRWQKNRGSKTRSCFRPLYPSKARGLFRRQRARRVVAFESFRPVELEARASGTPVVVTNTCGVAERIGTDGGRIDEHDERGQRAALLAFCKRIFEQKLDDNDRKLGKKELCSEKRPSAVRGSLQHSS